MTTISLTYGLLDETKLPEIDEDSNYDDIVMATPSTTILVSDFVGSYSGDALYLLYDGSKDMYGFVVFGYGSCSGCDMLEAARGNIEEMQNLHRDMVNRIGWANRDDMLAYLITKDFSTEYYYGAESKQVIDGMIQILFNYIFAAMERSEERILI